jgi:hypothetical protein
MSRRYWLPILAVVGLLAGGVQAQPISHGASGDAHPGKSQHKPKSDAPPSIPLSVQDDIHSIARALEAANKKPDAPKDNSEPDQYAKKNLEDQSRMAFWAAGMFWVGLLELIVTLVGVGLVWRTLKATWATKDEAKRAADSAADAVTKAQDTMEQAERHARQELRAYFSISKRECSIPTAAGFTQIRLKIKNCGSTPAYRFHQSLSAWVDTYPIPLNRPSIRDGIKFRGKLYIGPGEEIRQQSRVRIFEADIPEIRAGKKAIWCSGVIHYRDAFGVSRCLKHESFASWAMLFEDADDRRMWISQKNNESD